MSEVQEVLSVRRLCGDISNIPLSREEPVLNTLSLSILANEQGQYLGSELRVRVKGQGHGSSVPDEQKSTNVPGSLHNLFHTLKAVSTSTQTIRNLEPTPSEAFGWSRTFIIEGVFVTGCSTIYWRCFMQTSGLTRPCVQMYNDLYPTQILVM
jgi:hypothetical protein